jgi:ribonuclease J
MYMVKLIFHKNPERIGGGITELRSGIHRLIIDMGADLPQEDFTLEPNPELPGLTCGVPTCDAVLISHYHGDHAGLLKYVLPGIPIYMSRVTRSVCGWSRPRCCATI